MHRADEKKAFEDMLAEIADDSDEEESSYTMKSHAKPPARFTAADSKGSDYLSSAGAKSVNTHSGGYQKSQPFQMSKQEQEIENFGSNVNQSASQIQSEQINLTKRWLSRSCSMSDRNTMKCYVERERSSFGMATIYRCYLEPANTNSGDGATSSAPAGSDGARFLMAAKKRVVNKTSYYLLSLDPNDFDDRGSESVLGKVRGNAIGSRYLITDHGLAPEKAVAPSMLRKEHGVISFEFDSGGPSRIEAWVPFVSSNGVTAIWQPDSEEGGMEAQIDQKQTEKMLYLQNKAPKWDETHGGHVLNFQGRVTESSVKNFQLCCSSLEDPDQVVLQFGRVGKHKFTMDLRYPLSPMQAFSICVACLDGKIADRKGYEYIKKFTTSAQAEAAERQEPSSEAAAAEAYNQGLQQNTIARQGSMRGSSSFSGMLREALPSKQYLKDKVNRTFK